MKISLRHTIVLFMLLMVNLNAETTYYVDAERPDDDGDGSSWATAKQYLQSALALAVDGDEIWVAAETYSSAFIIGSGFQIYGGFSGSEEHLEERNWAENETILTNREGTVVTFMDASDQTVLDGFTITGGSAGYRSQPNNGNGGGIYNDN